MQLRTILPALAVLVGTLPAQPPGAKPGSVEGIVTNAVTGEPVKKATVNLMQIPAAGMPSDKTAITDAVGHFRFDQVEAGSYLASPDKDGFERTFRVPAPNSAHVIVAEEQQVQNVALKLVPVATISGHVLDEDGDPIPRAQVAILRYFYGSGRKRLNQTTSAQTNDLGEFEVIDLPPGRYYALVSVPASQDIPPRTRWTRPEEAYPLTFYPNAREAGQAVAIDLAAGAHFSDIDFQLRKTPAYHIRGRIDGEISAFPRALAGLIVEAPDTNTAIAQSKLKAGNFDLGGLAPGIYAIRYLQFIEIGLSNATETIHVADGDINGLTLARKPPLNLTGTVTAEGAQPDPMDLHVTLVPVHGKDFPGADAASQNGKVEFKDVPPNVYEFQIFNVPRGKYVKSIRFGDREINSGELDLTEQSSAPFNILLGTDGGDVDGTVQTATGEPAAMAEVTLAAAEEYEARADLFKTAVTDAGGNFSFKDVAPGEYKVLAWQLDTDDSTRYSEFRKPFESRSAAITVGPKDKVSVQLSVITADDMAQERSKLP